MSEFAGKVLLLTGAAGGIGSAVAETFVEAGAAVLLADRDATAVRALAQRLGDRALPFAYDAASSQSANEAVAFCLERSAGSIAPCRRRRSTMSIRS